MFRVRLLEFITYNSERSHKNLIEECKTLCCSYPSNVHG